MSRMKAASAPLGVRVLSASFGAAVLLAFTALQCGPDLPPVPPAPPPPPTETTPPAPPASTTKAEVAAPPAASATPPAAPRPPLVVAKGCLARDGVEGDVQARMKDAWKAANLFENGKTDLENEGSRKLSIKPLADLDGDGTEELTLADEGTGNYNQLTFLYVSNKGCWKFSHVTMATAFTVSKAAAGKATPRDGRDLGVVQKASSCNDPKDRDAYAVTTFRASEAGWTKARTTVCPCARGGGKGKKPTGDCAFELP